MKLKNIVLYARNVGLISVFIFALFSLISCDSEKSSTKVKYLKNTDAHGMIEIDGSSTVYPITVAVAEEFRKSHQDVQIPVGISGTGGGMKRFTKGEISIADASRPIKEKEAAAAEENDIEFIELEVAYDGLSVMVNPSNDWVDCLTTQELNKIWAPDSKIRNWSEIRDGFPDQALRLYGPGTDSGTFDYFTDTINGEEGASRADYTPSEDDNVLVQGISGDKGALGYFGYAYYIPNQDKLKLVSVDGGTGCVSPTTTTINDGTYSPLSRPLLIYVNKTHLTKQIVKEFVTYYVKNAAKYSEEVGYVPLPDSLYDEELKKIQ
jgi:phosphate transport system substrate-binding protein